MKERNLPFRDVSREMGKTMYGAWLIFHTFQACTEWWFWMYNKVSPLWGPRVWELGVRGFPVSWIYQVEEGYD